jgi:hypothetical protein
MAAVDKAARRLYFVLAALSDDEIDVFLPKELKRG